LTASPKAGWLWAVVLLFGVVSTGGNLMRNRGIAAIDMARASLWL
jgi:hypothetical protein